MRIQGIWDCPDQDQEVGAKHINETEMFQLTSRELMEPIDENGGDLVDLKVKMKHLRSKIIQEYKIK